MYGSCNVHVMRFFLELFVFFNCFSLTLEVTVPDDSDDEFAYEEVRFFLFGYIFWQISIQGVSLEIHVKFHNSGVPIFVLLIK